MINLHRTGTRLRCRLPVLVCICWASFQAWAIDFRIGTLDLSGTITWTNAYTNGACALEVAPTPTGPWTSQTSYYTTNSTGQGQLAETNGVSFWRLLAADFPPTPRGWTNLLKSYGRLETIAGNGVGQVDGVNYWQASFEGQPATQVSLSRPHIALADKNGDVFIADKNSHAVLKVTLDGRIHTVAGTHAAGFNGDGDGHLPGTSLQLNSPNGLWSHGGSMLYILDTGNGKVRKLDKNGIMTTLFTVPGGIQGGRGLWVKKDESEAYFCSGTEFKHWTNSGAFAVVNSGFVDLGNLADDPAGGRVITDAGANRVWHITKKGKVTLLAGNGGISGGGDGFLATQTGLAGVRGAWVLPFGGLLTCTQIGGQIWYIDTAGYIHLFLDGGTGTFRDGDGQYFHSPGKKISEPRSVTVADNGDIYITENDYGFVRKISFQRLEP